MAVGLTMKHGLYNENLNGKLNHICWDKEIVKTVHPRPLGNRKTNDMSKVDIGPWKHMFSVTIGYSSVSVTKQTLGP